jgi:protein TonB
MRAQANVLLAVALVAGCSAPPSPPEQRPSPPAAAPPPAPTPPPRVAAPKLLPPKTPLDAYKREMAQQILDRNATSTFEGAPPHFLRAVVVLQLTLDANGKVTQVKTLRTRDTGLAKAAADSVRAAAPPPAPPPGLLRRGSLEVAETWLFRDDGKFQVRSLAEEQR